MIIKPSYWQTAPKTKLASAVLDRLKSFNSQSESRRTDYELYLSAYLNRRTEIRAGGFQNFRDSIVPFRKYSFNAIASIVDTLAARLSSQKTFPKILTEDGQEEDRRMAADLEQFLLGTFQYCKFYRLLRAAIFDMLIYGNGYVKIFPCHDTNQVQMERVHPICIVVDEDSCVDTPPRELFEVRSVSAMELAEAYPKHEKAIHAAVGSEEWIRKEGGPAERRPDRVNVVEAFWLASASGKSGRHAIIIDGAVLYDDRQYERSYFPYVTLCWTDKTVGFYGQGIAERQLDAQSELRKLDGRIQDAVNMYATTNTFYEEGSINPKHFKNTVGNLIPFKIGHQPPVHYAPPPMAAQVYEQRERRKLDIFEGEGVSQLSAGGVKPAGVEAGIALRYLSDNETMRFSDKVQVKDEASIDASRLVIDSAKELSSSAGGYKARYVDKDFMKVIDFGKVDLDKSKYVIGLHPTNFLPHLPSGKLATIDDMIRMGLIDDPKDAMALLDQPDVQRYRSDKLIMRDLVDKACEDTLRTGKRVDLPPYVDPALIVQRGTSAILRAQLHGGNAEHLATLEEWVSDSFARAGEVRASQEREAAMAAQQGQQQQQQPAMPAEAPQPLGG